MNNIKDEDLLSQSKDDLVRIILDLRNAIRLHRDSTGHDLCWFHPELWNLLPEKSNMQRNVPNWCEFMTKCAEYRSSLDKDKK